MITKKNIKNLLLENLNDYLVLFEDRANMFSLETEYTNEYKFFSDEASNFIENNFLKKKKENKNIENYTIYGVKNFDTYGNKIFVSFEKGDYKTYLASKEEDYRKFIKDGNFFIFPISVASIVTTRDNKILVFNEDGNYKLPGNIITTEDVNGDDINFSNCINRYLVNKKVNIDLIGTEIIGIYRSTNSFIFILDQKTNEFSKNIDNAEFINNNVSTLGEIISGNNYLRRIRQAFKFYLKEHFNNYTYINIKLK